MYTATIGLTGCGMIGLSQTAHLGANFLHKRNKSTVAL